MVMEEQQRDMDEPERDREAPQRDKFSNYLLTIVIVFGNFWFGFECGILNPLGDKMLREKYGYSGDTDSEKNKRDNISGLLNNLFSIGALVGVLLTGAMADRIGRRAVMYITDIIALVTAGLFFFININVLMTARFLGGTVAGMYSSIGAVIVAELMPNSVCGFGNAFGYTILTFGILFAYCLPLVFEESTLIDHCNLFLMIPMLVPIIKLSLQPFLLKSDTPKFIFNQNVDKVRARELIIDAYSHIYALESLQDVANETLSSLEKQDLYGKVTITTLFSQKYRSRLFSGMYMCFAQQVSGINYLIFYSTELFKKSQKEKIMTVVIGASNFFGSFIALYAISRYGRKFNIVWGSLGQALGMLLLFLGFKFDEFPVLAGAVVIYICTFAIGLGGSQMAYISEILPPLGVSISCAVQWIMTAIIAQVLLPLNTLVGPNAMILFFTGACVFFFFSLDFLMIETKGKTEDTINTEFENRRYRFLNFK